MCKHDSVRLQKLKQSAQNRSPEEDVNPRIQNLVPARQAQSEEKQLLTLTPRPSDSFIKPANGHEDVNL